MNAANSTAADICFPYEKVDDEANHRQEDDQNNPRSARGRFAMRSQDHPRDHTEMREQKQKPSNCG